MHSKADTDIMLGENGELILKNKEITNNFNDHFGSIVDNISLDHWEDHSQSPTMCSDNIIKRYKNNPIIKNIKAKSGGLILTNCINKSIKTGCFPDTLKEANITPTFEKDDPLDKSSYRPVSILPLISKVHERLIYNQLSEYTESF